MNSRHLIIKQISAALIDDKLTIIFGARTVMWRARRLDTGAHLRRHPRLGGPCDKRKEGVRMVARIISLSGRLWPPFFVAMHRRLKSEFRSQKEDLRFLPGSDKLAMLAPFILRSHGAW